MKSVILHGPTGCGKTFNARAIAKAFNLPHIKDGWPPRSGDIPPLNNTLVITNNPPTPAESYGLRVVSFKEAMQRVRLS